MLMKSKMGRSDEDTSPHQLDKTQVLQEAKHIFSRTSVDTSKLIDVLTKCIFILMRGERLTSTEATELFHSITKLLQYKDKDSTLRRLTHIAFKALSKQAENVYLTVAQQLTNDVNSSRTDSAGVALKASALRALCHISDDFTSIERNLKQCLTDKHPEVASAALSSLVRVTSSGQKGSDIVGRCTQEILKALDSDSPMVQYHALALRYNSCKNDRVAISWLIEQCTTRKTLKSRLATCLWIRIVHNFIVDFKPDEAKKYVGYIVDKLSHPDDMVKYEAVNAIVSLPRNYMTANACDVSKKRLTKILGEFLSSSRAALKFGAVRTLNKLADYAPSEVREISIDLDNLISQSDCNRSIAILAITTLLKIGTENSVEKFLKQIGEFLAEIDEEFKILVMGSVRQLCSRYPSKHVAMMDFLSSMLREEGGYTYKKAIVNTIINMILDNQETKEKGLEQLCEFIEDCEHVNLAVEVIHFLGSEGPKMRKAQTYTRYLANRPLLDPTPVAVASISALAKFGSVPELRDSIMVALDRFSFHEDYEVMETARFYRGILEMEDEDKKSSFLNPSLNVDLADLEIKLSNYIAGDYSEPFDMSDVSHKAIKTTYVRDEEHESSKEIDTSSKKPEDKREEIPSGLPRDIFQEVGLGNLCKSTEPTSLTDSVSEFGVKCVKHIYQGHIVFQFNCTNTVDELYLEDVSIEMCAPAGFNVIASTVYPKLAYGDTVPIYVCVELVDDSAYTEPDLFTNVYLKFKSRTVDPETKEPRMDEELNEDDFPLEDILIDLSKLIPDDLS